MEGKVATEFGSEGGCYSQGYDSGTEQPERDQRGGRISSTRGSVGEEADD